MPRPAPYTGVRRTISQALLWLILAGTVALAALVDQSVNRSQNVSFSEPIAHGNMTVRIPRGWKLIPTEGTTAVISVRENAGDEEARTLTVYRQRIGNLRSPFEFLAAGGLIDPDMLAGSETPFEPTMVAGSPGILVTLRYADPANEQPRKMIVACAILPSRLAVTVKLEGPGAADVSDARLVQRVAQDIKLSDAPAKLPAGALVTWPNGLSIKSPDQFRAIDDRDPQTTSRFLIIDDSSPQQWASIEITPCIYFQADGASVATTLLGAHDQRMFHATITQLSPGRYRAIAPAEQGMMPAVSYVAADADGHAVMATFRGTSSRVDEFDSLWNEIDQSIHFATTQCKTLLEAGRRQVAQIQTDGLDKLIPAAERDEQWWRWVDNFAGRPYGWSHFRFDHATKLDASRETRKRGEKSLVYYITQTWVSSPDLRSHTAMVERKISADAQGDLTQDFRQQILIRRGRVNVSITSDGQLAPSIEAPLPLEFIPGAWIPNLIGHFSSTPMMIRTESLFGSEADFATAFQTLLVTPAEAPKGSESGTRIFTLEVNGTGKLSRWTIGPDGQLDRVDFADGIYCERSDIEATRLTFKDDPRMTP